MFYRRNPIEFKEKTTKFQKNKQKTIDKQEEIWYSVDSKPGILEKSQNNVVFTVVMKYVREGKG